MVTIHAENRPCLDKGLLKLRESLNRIKHFILNIHFNTKDIFLSNAADSDSWNQWEQSSEIFFIKNFSDRFNLIRANINYLTCKKALKINRAFLDSQKILYPKIY